MKRILFGLLMMFVTGAPIAAQTGASAPAAVVDCGCEDKRLADILGVVNGIKITRQDLSAQTRSRVEQLQRDVIEARQRELDLQIDSLLLEAEAKKRQVSTTQLLKDEVVAKVSAPTEAEAQAFYEKNKTQIQKEFKDSKDDIVGYLRYQRQQEEARKLAERLRAAAQVKVLAKPSAPPANDADRARLLAVVNGKQITMGDVETSLRPLIFNVQEQVYALRKQDLELKINDTLLTQEAQKKQITTRALLEAEVNAKVAPVTEAQAQEFFEKNKERISGDFAQTKSQIIEYLKETREQEATLAFAEQLRRASAIQINLTAPESPAFEIATDDQPTQGRRQSAVSLLLNSPTSNVQVVRSSIRYLKGL